jgi:lysozyme
MIRRIIDISHHQDPINFGKVAADGIIAIIAKATEGATWTDPAYERFKFNAAKYKFLWGSYHFGTNASVAAQVEHYLAITKPTENELVCLDFEENPNGVSMTIDQARQFVRLLRDRIARFPVVYGGVWLKQQLNGKPDNLLSRCPLWIARYGVRPDLPIGWRRYALWQYTDGQAGPEPHEVDGIGPCDRSQYNGTIRQLRARWPFS